MHTQQTQKAISSKHKWIKCRNAILARTVGRAIEKSHIPFSPISTFTQTYTQNKKSKANQTKQNNQILNIVVIDSESMLSRFTETCVLCIREKPSSEGGTSGCCALQKPQQSRRLPSKTKQKKIFVCFSRNEVIVFQD